MVGPGRTFTHHGQWPINGTGPPGTPTLNMDIFPPPAALNLRLTCPKLIVARFSFITQNIFHLLIYMVYYIDTASYIIFFNRVLYLFFFFRTHPVRSVTTCFNFPGYFSCQPQRGRLEGRGAGLSKNMPASWGGEGDGFPHFEGYLWLR